LLLEYVGEFICMWMVTVTMHITNNVKLQWIVQIAPYGTVYFCEYS